MTSNSLCLSVRAAVYTVGWDWGAGQEGGFRGGQSREEEFYIQGHRRVQISMKDIEK